ncbi:MAG TPA: hypothetical protein VGD16_08970 [Enterovirga sp.]|jgi:hypothetical protein
MRSRFNLYLAGLLVLEALIVRGGAPRLPERQGTLVLAAALQRQMAAGDRSRAMPRFIVQYFDGKRVSGVVPS